MPDDNHMSRGGNRQIFREPFHNADDDGTKIFVHILSFFMKYNAFSFFCYVLYSITSVEDSDAKFPKNSQKNDECAKRVIRHLSFVIYQSNP